MAAQAPSQAGSRPDRTVNCPTCGAEAERGQLMCLECGSRIALGRDNPPSWKVPVAMVTILLLALGAGAFFGLRALTDDAEKDAAKKPVKVAAAKGDEAKAKASEKDSRTQAADDEKPTAAERKQAAEEAAAQKRAAAAERRREARADRRRAREQATAPVSGGALVERDGLYVWPLDLVGFTVVVLSNEDRASATRAARELAQASRRDKVGVIRSNDFETLPKGFFVVFAGKYPNRRAAQRAANRLGRNYRGAFPQRVAR